MTVVGDGQLVANKVSYATLTPEPTNVPLDVVPYNDTCFQLRDGVMVQDCPRLKAVLPADVPYGWGARLHIEVPGYQIYHERVELKVDIHVILTPVPKHPVAGETSRVRSVGRAFVNADGVEIHMRSLTQFLTFARFARGENVDEQLTYAVEHDRNMIRFWAAGVGWPASAFCPECGEWSQRPDLSKLPAFWAKLAEWGLYGEGTVVTGDDRTLAEWRAILQYVYDVAAGRPNSFVEGINEPWNVWARNLQPSQLYAGINTHDVPTACGSIQWPYPQGYSPDFGCRGTYVTWHSPRDYAHFGFNGKDAYEIKTISGFWNNMPVIDDEPLGIADFERIGAAARTNRLDLLSGHFATCALFANGCTLHINSGYVGKVPAVGSVEDSLVQQLALVSKFYPARAASGTYTAIHLGGFAMDYRTGDSTVNHGYGMTVDGNVQWVVIPLPRVGYTPVGKDGWRIGAFGPQPGMLMMVR